MRSASSTGRSSRRTSTTLQTRATAQRIDYMLLKTSMPLDHALFRFLSMRDRLTRTR